MSSSATRGLPLVTHGHPPALWLPRFGVSVPQGHPCTRPLFPNLPRATTAPVPTPRPPLPRFLVLPDPSNPRNSIPVPIPVPNPLSPQARDVYEEAVQTVMTVRDFTQVFDSYAQFEESVIAAKMETVAELGKEEDGEFRGAPPQFPPKKNEFVDALPQFPPKKG